MKWFKSTAPVAALLVVACSSGPVRVLQPVSTAIQGNSHVAEVAVTLSPLAQSTMVPFEDKARQERQEAGLAPVPAEGLSERPPRDQYRTLPFAEMFELVVQDVTREAGLVAGRPVRLAVEVDTLKTANAAMAILAASSDQLAGTVTVLDAATGERLGEFYVDVINGHSGLLGLAMRGSGVRESLSEEFAVHITRQLRAQQARR